jgi:hypothetical protein
VVRIGAQSAAVVVSVLGRTTTVQGALVANTLSVSGPLSSTSISAAGALTATSLSTGGAASAAALTVSGELTVAGTTWLAGSLLLGNDALFTVGRRPASSVRGMTTYLLGQRAGSVFSCVVGLCVA